MKTIIIPIDYSGVTTSAMKYGIDLAVAVNAGVLLFNVYSVPVAITDVPVMLVSVEDLENSANKEMEAKRLVAESFSQGRVKIETETRLGDTIDELEKICDEIQPFAVVMATRESSGIERALLGSTTFSAVKRLKWAVIAVPPGKDYGAGIKKIGFACDLKDVVETTPAGAIKDFVTQFNAELHVLNVNHNGDSINRESSGEYVLLKSMLAEAHPVFNFIESDDVETGINNFAEQNQLDLLIVIPKKHKFLDGLFKKHSTKKLMFHSDVPVMCIHE